MTEHLCGCGGLMWVGDGDSNPHVWSAVVKQPHTLGQRSTSLRGTALLGPLGGASDGSLYVGTETATMRES